MFLLPETCVACNGCIGPCPQGHVMDSATGKCVEGEPAACDLNEVLRVSRGGAVYSVLLTFWGLVQSTLNILGSCTMYS